MGRHVFGLRKILILTGLFVLAMLLRWGFVEQIDAMAFDFALRLRGPEPPDPRVVIVAVDDQSLDSIGSWPWPTEVQERLVARILSGQPAVLGLDLLLPSIGGLPTLASSDARIVLGTSLGRGHGESEPYWQEPKDWTEVPNRALGHIHAGKDLDGVCRSIPLSVSLAGRRRWAFALETARLFWNLPEDALAFAGDRLVLGQHSIPRLEGPLDPGFDSKGVLASLPGDRLLINSRGAPQTFPYVAARDVISGSGDLGPLLRGKIVLVGATSYSLGDHLATAFSGATESPGIEIHANALDTILNERFVTVPSESLVALMMAATLAMSWWLLNSWTKAWTLAAYGGVILSIFAVCLAALYWLGYWLPMASLAMTATISAGSAQFVRFSQLNHRLNQRFDRLSGLLDSFSAGGRRFDSKTKGYLTRSLEWKMGVLGEAADNAMRQARAEQEMTSFLSHELKTPLTAVVGLTDLAVDPAGLSDQERLETLALIRRESLRLSKMIDDYLQLAHVEQGRLPEMGPLDVSEVLGWACELAAPLFSSRSLRLELTRNGSRKVRGNSGLLTQVFLNLLENAAKFSPVGGRIRVAMERRDGRVWISIQDDGSGIAEADLDRVFEKFYRGQPPGGRSAVGSGLGLAFVKQVVETYGGTVEVRSRPGEGSIFSVALPELEQDGLRK